ncbi:MAG: hypothetical protein HGA85_08680, partial [Nanoarchaeota archaeon]|nr:hypothetical protein [Nanoarchaeota archaeon]
QETLYSDFVLSNDNLTVAYLKHEVSYFRENRTLNSREDLNYTYYKTSLCFTNITRGWELCKEIKVPWKRQGTGLDYKMCWNRDGKLAYGFMLIQQKKGIASNYFYSGLREVDSKLNERRLRLGVKFEDFCNASYDYSTNAYNFETANDAGFGRRWYLSKNGNVTLFISDKSLSSG